MRWDLERNVVEPLLSRYNTERFKGVNDLTISTDGDIYFTDQGQTGLHDSTGRVFRYSRQGRLELLLDNVPSPNGLVLNTDESILYLAATRDNSVWRVPLSRSGGVYKVSRFLSFNGPLGPDGLALSPLGNLIVATPGIGQVWVANEYGEMLERFDCRKIGNLPSNIALDTVHPAQFYITESSTGTILLAETKY
jgi:gluconolactonase